MSVATAQTPQRITMDPSEPGLWHASVPKQIRKTYRAAPHLGWAVWASHLQARKRPRQLAELLPGGRKAILWSLPGNSWNSPSVQILHALADVTAKSKPAARLSVSSQLRSWLSDSLVDSEPLQRTLEMLAWISVLPRLATMVAEDVWWDFVQEAIRTAEHFELANPEVSPLAGQLLDCELKIALSHQLPELRACRELGVLGRDRLSETLTGILDEGGLAPGCPTTEFGPLVASWVRCAAMLHDQGHASWSELAQQRFVLAAHNLFRLARKDGSVAFERAAAAGWNRKFSSAVRQCACDRKLDRIAELATSRSAETNKLPRASIHSEPASLGILRGSWRSTAPRLTASYVGRQVTSELSIAGEVIWSGPSNPQLRAGGIPLEISSNWEEVCWVSDDDVDYLELEATFSGHHRVQRQMLLAKTDRFVLVADAILGENETSFEYKLSLPLAADFGFAPAKESREGMLQGRKAEALVLPLGLGEWRTDNSRGELVEEDSRLILRHSVRGSRMYAPLFVSFDAKRIKRGITWRQLTIAEMREQQRIDVAVGYRVQIGKRQWLIYRSLAPPAIRTVLAQNLSTEFLTARFHRDGKASTIVEVEP